MQYHTIIEDFWPLHGDEDTAQFVDASMHILDIIHYHMETKNMSFDKFCVACKVDKKTAASWLAPMHNFTIRELTILQNALDIKIFDIHPLT